MNSFIISLSFVFSLFINFILLFFFLKSLKKHPYTQYFKQNPLLINLNHTIKKKKSLFSSQALPLPLKLNNSLNRLNLYTYYDDKQTFILPYKKEKKANTYNFKKPSQYKNFNAKDIFKQERITSPFPKNIIL